MLASRAMALQLISRFLSLLLSYPIATARSSRPSHPPNYINFLIFSYVILRHPGRLRLVARNVHVMQVRWMSDIHQRVTSARFPLAELNSPAACAALLKMYVKDLLAAARERRVEDDWCVGGHVDFYRQGSGRFWFLIHPKFGGVKLLKEKAKKPPTLTPGPRGGALGGGAGDATPGTGPNPVLMADGQRCVCSQHLC
ncbi:hypothetical protein B484DRAFT_15623, partial [Ochromonadaceae sp. CCMP2298]